MRKLTPALALIVLLTTVAATQEEIVVEEVLIKINDDVITKTEFERSFDPFEQQLQAEFSGEELAQATQQLRTRLFNVMVNRMLLRQRAEQYGIRMSESNFQDLKSYYMQRSNSRSEEEFRQALNDAGMSLADFRRQAEDQFIQQRLFSIELFAGEENLESKYQEYYERNAERYMQPARFRLSQLMFDKSAEGGEEAARARAEEALQRIRSGEDFGEVFRSYNPQAGATANGDIGQLNPDSLREDLAASIRELDQGEATDVLETPAAFVIFYATEKQEAKQIPLEEIQDRVIRDLQQERLQEGLTQLILQYKERSFIEVRSDEFFPLYDPASTTLDILSR